MTYELVLQGSEDAELSNITTTTENRWKELVKQSYKRLSSTASEHLAIWLFRLVISICLIRLAFFPRCEPCAADRNNAQISHYGANTSYMSLDPRYDELWRNLSLHSVYGALIWSSEGINGGREKIGAISMFHQLHCLESFRTALQDARAGKDIGLDSNDNKHWPHCLDYMRKSVLCFADGTIERPVTIPGPNGSHTREINGVDDPRKCGYPEALYTLLKEKNVTQSYPYGPTVRSSTRIRSELGTLIL